MPRMLIVVLGLLTAWLTLTAPLAFASESLDLSKFSPYQPEPEPVHDFGDNDPNVIVALGDSITAGYPFVPWEETYPAQLQALIGRTVVNGGSGGARSSEGVATINYFLRRFKPGYTLIMYGANDVMERSPQAITNNLMTMAWMALENKTIPILSTVTPVDGPKIGRQSAILRLNETIVARAAEFGYLVADISSAYGLEGQYLLADGLHPNSAGMGVIATTFHQKILEAENQNNADEGGGGGGCTVTSHDRLAGDWLIVLTALSALFLCGRKWQKNRTGPEQRYCKA